MLSVSKRQATNKEKNPKDRMIFVASERYFVLLSISSCLVIVLLVPFFSVFHCSSFLFVCLFVSSLCCKNPHCGWYKSQQTHPACSRSSFYSHFHAHIAQTNSTTQKKIGTYMRCKNGTTSIIMLPLPPLKALPPSEYTSCETTHETKNIEIPSGPSAWNGAMFSGKMIIPEDDVRTDNNKGELDRERPTKARHAQGDPFFWGGVFFTI